MSDRSQIKIGWAWVDITPDKPVQVAGQFHERISMGVHDPLTATVLALEGNDGEQAIMVSCDVGGIRGGLQSRLREVLAARGVAFDPRKLFLAATHTHTAPGMTDDAWYPPARPGMMSGSQYAALLVERLSEAIIRAWEMRRPGGVSWALGHAVIGHNRRVAYADGHTLMYGPSDRPDFRGMEGGEDHGVELLYTWDNQSNLTGVVVNPACPSQVVEGKYYLSADYWYIVRQELRRRHGADLCVLPLCSAAGDQSPRDLVRRGRGEANGREEEGLVELGQRLANCVEEMLPAAAAAVRSDVPVKHMVQEVALPAAVVPAEQAEEAQRTCDEIVRKQPALGSAEYGRWRFLLRLLERYARQGDHPLFKIELHAVRVGEVAFCTNPFELFLGYGLQIKARSKALQTFVIQLACDVGGYLPTDKAVAGGHYSAQIASNQVRAEGGQVLVEKTVEAINSLF